MTYNFPARHLPPLGTPGTHPVNPMAEDVWSQGISEYGFCPSLASAPLVLSCELLLTDTGGGQRPRSVTTGISLTSNEVQDEA